MQRATFVSSLAIGLLLVAGSVQAADAAQGKQQYQGTCAACHGANGISIAPIYPNVAGQKQDYVETQLKAFRDGSRKNAIMEPMAKGLTDAEIANLAAYIAQLKP